MSKIYIDVCDNLKMFYILEKKKKINNRKLKKVVNFFLLFKYKLYYMLNVSKEIEFNNKRMYIIYSRRNTKAIESKVHRELEKNRCVLSKKIVELLKDTDKKKIKEAIDYSKNDKYIFFKNIYKVLEYVLAIRNENIETTNLYVLANNDLKNRELIIKLGMNSKSLNIVTNNIKEFKLIEDYMFNNYGISIIRTNNKRKALLRAKYVINLEFGQDIINEYSINREAIIFNFSECFLEKIKGFNGIIINNAEFEVNKKVGRSQYIYRRFLNNMEENSLEIEIMKVIGNNGMISLKELTK